MMSTTVDISIIILFKQKDKKFQQAVSSSQFATEIITVENKKIANFSQVRNQALKKVTQEWVFFLDSDEVIVPESIVKIKKIIKDNLFDGVTVKRKDIFYHQIISYGEAGNIKLLRMGKKDKMIWKRPVHELAEIKGVVNNSNIEIIHYAHSSLNDFLTSIVNYAEIEAKYRTQLNKKTNLISLIIFPVGKFIANYLIKRGFLDGWRGLSYALMMSLHSFSVRIFQYELKS